MADKTNNPLGAYLMDRRARLDPAAFGFPVGRRRTPGLRREEVAQRANVSPTWYTWLEQGRGGAPSSDVLPRISHALMLTDAEREYIFLLAFGRPPNIRYQTADGITPRLQRVLDSLESSPAYVKTSTWDIVAWNRAAAMVLTDYGALLREQRNILRLIFSNPRMPKKMPNWESDARFVVAAFRADVARAGASANSQALVEDLSRISPEFNAMWAENTVSIAYGEHPKHVMHPVVGLIALEYSAFAVDGRPDLGMVIYSPATPKDRALVQSLMAGSSKTSRPLEVGMQADS
jgi:transcriptional regulator with XRE-family HTH domain